MSAQVRYLARLARQATGPAALRPPRQLFAGEVYAPGRSPGRASPLHRVGGHPERSTPGGLARSESGGEPLILLPRDENRGAVPAAANADTAADPGAVPAAANADTAADRGPGAPGAPGPGARAGSAGIQAAPADLDVLEPARVPRGSPAAPRTEPALAASDPGARAAGTGLAAYPVTPLASGDSRPADDAPRSQPAESRTNPPGAAPAEPPGTVWPGPVHRETGSSVPPGAGEPDRSAPAGRPAAVRELLPPPALASLPMKIRVPEQGGPREQHRGTRPARVSIGTIEVTVAPPVRTHEIGAPVPAVRDWLRPSSRPAASARTDGWRDGLRRWYGTAQG